MVVVQIVKNLSKWRGYCSSLDRLSLPVADSVRTFLETGEIVYNNWVSGGMYCLSSVGHVNFLFCHVSVSDISNLAYTLWPVSSLQRVRSQPGAAAPDQKRVKKLNASDFSNSYVKELMDLNKKYNMVEGVVSNIDLGEFC